MDPENVISLVGMFSIGLASVGVVMSKYTFDKIITAIFFVTSMVTASMISYTREIRETHSKQPSIIELTAHYKALKDDQDNIYECQP